MAEFLYIKAPQSAHVTAVESITIKTGNNLSLVNHVSTSQLMGRVYNYSLSFKADDESSLLISLTKQV